MRIVAEAQVSSEVAESTKALVGGCELPRVARLAGTGSEMFVRERMQDWCTLPIGHVLLLHAELVIVVGDRLAAGPLVGTPAPGPSPWLPPASAAWDRLAGTGGELWEAGRVVVAVRSMVSAG